MPVARPVIFDGGMQRQMNVGDVLSQMETTLTDTTNTTLTLTPAMVLAGVLIRNPSGVSTDTFPDAASLIAAMQQGIGLTGVQQGTSFRLKFINVSANTITPAVPTTASSGVTNGGRATTTIATTVVRDYLFVVTNGTPAVGYAGAASTNSSAVISGLPASFLSQVSVGMQVINAVVGIQGNTVIGINIAAGTLTLSGNANATNASFNINLSPTYTVTSLAGA